MSKAGAGRSRASVGDVAVVEGHRVGEAKRTGEILEVLGDPDHEHYRVRWDDGHESIFYPGNDVTIRHAGHKPTEATP